MLNDGTTLSDKIPSALEIFLNSAAFDNTNVFTPAPVDSRPIMAMTKEWETCVNQDGRDAICPLMQSVTALLFANYENYLSVGLKDQDTWKDVWGCTGQPVAMTRRLFLAHLLRLDSVPGELHKHRSEPALPHARLRRSEKAAELRSR